MKEYHKKTVLQVVPALVSGGVERGTIEIAKKLKSSEFNPIVISAGGQLIDQLEEIEIPHLSLKTASKNPFTMWRNTRLLTKIIKDYDIDLIHARSRAPAWSCYMAAKATNKRFITTFHGIYNISGFLKRYYNSIMVEGERIIAVSNYVKRHILENYNADESKIRVIHRGVDHQYFDMANIMPEQLNKFREKYNVPADVPVILLPSRMTAWKGHISLIEALSRIRHLSFYCLMVGDLSKHPNFVKRVQSKIKETKMQGRIQIFGNETNMLKLYGIADIVLSTSIEPEAFGRTITEGQSMSKLVIATNIGGAIETIEDGVTGFHVSPGNITELADKISYCLSITDSTSSNQIVKAARKSVVDKFSLNLMLDKTLAVYRELI
ncbi:MAG: glycosyltransferase [Rickettsiaceae bacterium]|nr:MAG: glycosyltransferase [Rickettsiaceae bacterium]